MTNDILCLTSVIRSIIWALTIIPLIKYAIIALEFGTQSTGEGGPFAIYTALYPPKEETDDNRVLTSYTTTSGYNSGAREGSFLDKPLVQRVLFGIVLFATCLTFSDGLLTPAVSVVSAVQGIAVAAPSVGNATVPISIAILVCLFILQALGTQKVGFLFGPVVALWLATTAISGAINIHSYPGVFRAFDPSRAVALFIRTGNFDLLSGVLLCITGVEAMVSFLARSFSFSSILKKKKLTIFLFFSFFVFFFLFSFPYLQFANLGQFNKQSIRISFMGYVYPCLIIAYLGQGARLIVDGDNVISNVFFQSVPGGVGTGFWYFTFVLAILAAIIASQAMISATFSLIQQLTRLEAMPALKIIHTNNEAEGQVFCPSVNIIVMIGTIALSKFEHLSFFFFEIKFIEENFY